MDGDWTKRMRFCPLRQPKTEGDAGQARRIRREGLARQHQGDDLEAQALQDLDGQSFPYNTRYLFASLVGCTQSDCL